MLLFMLMESPLLENGSNDLDLRPIHEMIEREACNAKYSHNQAKKQALILIHRASCFDGNDIESFLRELSLQNEKIDRSSEIMKPTYLQIMLKFFIANFKAQTRIDLQGAATLSKELINEIAAYFGHDENIFSLAPRAIVLEKRFEDVASIDL